MDVEGAERDIISDWINSESGVLDRVLQIGVEFHDVMSHVNQYYAIVRGLYRRGFRLISFDPNLNQVPLSDSGFFKMFELVFRKTAQPCDLGLGKGTT